MWKWIFKGTKLEIGPIVTAKALDSGYTKSRAQAVKIWAKRGTIAIHDQIMVLKVEEAYAVAKGSADTGWFKAQHSMLQEANKMALATKRISI